MVASAVAVVEVKAVRAAKEEKAVLLGAVTVAAVRAEAADSVVPAVRAADAAKAGDAAKAEAAAATVDSPRVKAPRKASTLGRQPVITFSIKTLINLFGKLSQLLLRLLQLLICAHSSPQTALAGDFFTVC